MKNSFSIIKKFTFHFQYHNSIPSKPPSSPVENNNTKWVQIGDIQHQVEVSFIESTLKALEESNLEEKLKNLHRFDPYKMQMAREKILRKNMALCQARLQAKGEIFSILKLSTKITPL